MADDDPFNPRDPYRRAQLRARAREHALRLDALRNLDLALARYAGRLAAQLRSLRVGDTNALRARAIGAALNLIDQERAQLLTAMTEAVSNGRATTFADVNAIQQHATRQIARAAGIEAAVLGAIQAPTLTTAGVWESLGGGARHWKTLLRGYVDGASAHASRIVTDALTQGMSPDELARRLRPYVDGSQPWQVAFRGAGEITDRMLRDARHTQAAGKLRYNADRIAFSEIHNARGEAELQAFAADPFVKAVRWTLSPNRGKLRRADACDGLAKTDWYGMGPGIFPVTQVPTFPHPFCRCERVPVPRPTKEMREPKPNPPRRVTEVKGTGCDHG